MKIAVTGEGPTDFGRKEYDILIGYSVRQVEEMVKALNNGETLKSGRRTLKPAGKKLPEEYAELQGRLRDMFSTKVQMTCSGQGKGKITIPFASEEELERIITTLDRL